MEQTTTSLQSLMQTFEDACRAANLKLTHQRIEIYRELAQSKDHPSAEALYRRLIKAMPTLSLDTVYRTLATFEQHNLVKKVDTVDSQGHYEAQMQQHHHVICENCREIMDFHWSDFDQSEVPQAVREWGAMKNINITIYGTCRKCQERNTPAQPDKE